MEEIDESEIKTGSKWKGIIVIAFTVIAISGMMYMLFTVDDYNKYGNGSSSSTDVSASDSANKTAASTGTNASEPSKISTEKPKASKAVNETPPVVIANAVKESQPLPKVETKPQVVVKVKEEPVIIPKPSPKVEIKQPAPVVVQPKPAIKPIVKPVVKKEKINTPSLNTPPAKPTAAKLKPVKEDKVMTPGELQDLVNNILAKSTAAGISVRCVQLHNTASGNNKTAIKQIESYLRSQKFTIAGRQMISSNSKDIQIIPVNNCMRLVVGGF